MAIKTIQTVATSPVIAAMFAACNAANAEADRHQREVLETGAFKTASADERKEHVTVNNTLNDAWVTTMYAVCQHPVGTAQDLHAKLAFMVEFEMGDGMDWLPTVLEDVQRIAGTSNAEWDEALAAVQAAAGPMRETSKAFHAIDATWCADRTQSPGTSTAWDVAWESYSVAMDRYHVELRNLIVMVPAPNAAAAAIKAQMFLDAQLNDEKLGEYVAADLRRFTDHADLER
ncbi:hypothetical protein [Sphingomonas sp. OK281]|uniref:hypothetical protein n=1 Tax=Sphingomonas sp. OK281 TaxID=1881067 RepID=UPI0008F1030C|nr:hypothetical protein [Sphingomonas sp. OK281]SFO02065.1 hypothetical protein SAMN05428984_1664 [Sphingomonas sp. OK281]